MSFIETAIVEHKSSDAYRTAYDADLYCKHKNPTIMRYQKFVYDQMGRKVPDIWSANNKIASNWYNYFTVQAVQYLLGNGVSFESDGTKEALGADFDRKIQDLAREAKNGGVSFGFWNNDHIEVFSLTEFVPLWDEEDGTLKAGIRFWQIDDKKPMRMTLFELDGYTEYIKRSGEDMQILNDKRTYKIDVAYSKADGERIVAWSNYPSFPIVPLWNTNKQSDLVGNRGTLDAYDLMMSGLINNVSEGEFIYWILKNCNAMSASDDAQFVEQLKLTHVAHADGDDGASVDAHTVEVPFEASDAALNRLERQLFKDFMALKVDDISAGATNDQIQAAYEPLNQKTDEFEYCVTSFIQGILSIIGIDDKPTYARSQLSNRAETIDAVLSAADHLPRDYVVEKIATLLGDIDRVDDLIGKRLEEDGTRYKDGEVIEDDDIE